MRLLRWAAAGWNRFWFREMDSLPLGVFRILIAWAGLYVCGANAVLLPEFYSDGGQLPIRLSRAWMDAYMSRFGMIDALGSLPVVTALLCAQVLAFLGLLLGYRLRVTATLAFLLTSWFQARNATFLNGGDEILRVSTFYLMIAFVALRPEQRALSWDRRQYLRSRAAGEDASRSARMPAWPLRLIQIQLSVVYLVAGFWKIWSIEWWDGSAFFYAMAGPTFGRFGLPAWEWLHYPFAGLAIATTWWEFLFPLLMILPRTRLWALGFGVLVHGGVAAMMNIGVFPYIMMFSYAAFLTGDEIRGSGLFQYLEERLGRFVHITKSAAEETTSVQSVT